MRIPLICAVVLLSGCCSIDTDPAPSFIEVQVDVKQRTGHTISWDQAEVMEGWLKCMLQQELSVGQAVQTALINNPSLKATYQKLGIAQAELAQAGLFKNPILNFSLRYENLVDPAYIIETSLVQNLLDILLKPLKKKLAYYELEIAKNEITGHVIHVISNTKSAFYTLQTAEHILDLKEQVLEAREAAYEVARRLHQAGNTTNLALSLECSKYEQAKLDLYSSQIDLTEAREHLQLLMGLCEQQTQWRLSKERAEIPKKPIDTHLIQKSTLANSVDLQLACRRLHATAARLGTELNELIFSEISFGPDSEREPSGHWFVGPQFSLGIPLFDTGIAKRASGNAELSRQCYEYIALRVAIASAARLASSRLMNAYKQCYHFHYIVLPLAEQTTHETLLQFNAMQLGVFDLLTAKQQELDAQIQAAISYRDYWIAHTELEMLLNGKMKRLNVSEYN